MSNIRNIKKHTLKNVCMIMLVLIQFDVCGYDFMHALQLIGEPVSELYATDSNVSDNEMEVSQWEDPVYRRSNSRISFKFLAVEFPSFVPFLHARELPYRPCYEKQFPTATSDVSFLRYCVLLI